MTVDFLARKASKRTAKRLHSMNQKAEGSARRNRKTRGRNRNTIGMCNFAPPLPPVLAEEDATVEADRRMKKRKQERERQAAKSMRKKVKMLSASKVKSDFDDGSGGSEEDDEDEKKNDGGSSDEDEDEDDDEWNEECERKKPRVSSDNDAMNVLDKIPEYFVDAMKTIGHRKIAPIQRASWNVLCQAKDCLAVAAPGSGKTLAFLLPAFDVVIRVSASLAAQATALSGNPNFSNVASRKNVIDGLIVAPTRELAQQIAAVGNKLKRAAPVKLVCMVGGTNQQEQEENLLAPTKLGVLVVGTPGRLCASVCFNKGGTKRSDDGKSNIIIPASENRLGSCKIFILDEADRMLALGFEPQLEQLHENLPVADRQTALFSATFPAKVKVIAQKWLRKEYEKVTLDSKAIDVTNDNAEKGKEELVQRASKVIQTVHVCAEHKKSRKLMKYVEKIRKDDGRARSRLLVFTNRIKTVQFVKDLLVKNGEKVSTLHGEMRQDKRELALKDFKAGKTPVLVATDVAGRGLDVAGLECVVNWDFPGSIEQYQHRIGRAGRNEKVGSALSFFTRKFAPLAKDLIELLQIAEQFVDPNLKILAKAAESLPELENNFRDKYGTGDVAIDEHGEGSDDDEEKENMNDDDDDDVDEPAAKNNSNKDESKKERIKRKEEREDKDDAADDEFTVPQNKPSIGEMKKKAPAWWEQQDGGTKIGAGRKKREEMKNPAMRNNLRCGPDDEEIQNRKVHTAAAEKKPNKKKLIIERKEKIKGDDNAATTMDKTFLSSKKFSGAKVGYFFAKGKKGLGYYVDRPPNPVAYKINNNSNNNKKKKKF